MRVSTDDHISGHGKPFFRKKGMLDTHLSYFKIIGDLIAACKLTYTFAMLCGFDIFIRYEMIGNQCDLILIKYTVYLHLVHFLDGNRAGDIISQDQIQLRFDELSSLYLIKSCRCRKDFLCHSHSHLYQPPMSVQ